MTSRHRMYYRAYDKVINWCHWGAGTVTIVMILIVAAGDIVSLRFGVLVAWIINSIIMYVGMYCSDCKNGWLHWKQDKWSMYGSGKARGGHWWRMRRTPILKLERARSALLGTAVLMCLILGG